MGRLKKVGIGFGVLIVLALVPAAAFAEGQVPSWLKTTASLWADGDITDKEFLTALQWLIDNGLLQVSGDGSKAAGEEPDKGGDDGDEPAPKQVDEPAPKLDNFEDFVEYGKEYRETLLDNEEKENVQISEAWSRFAERVRGDPDILLGGSLTHGEMTPSVLAMFGPYDVSEIVTPITLISGFGEPYVRDASDYFGDTYIDGFSDVKYIVVFLATVDMGNAAFQVPRSDAVGGYNHDSEGWVLNYRNSDGFKKQAGLLEGGLYFDDVFGDICLFDGSRDSSCAQIPPNTVEKGFLIFGFAEGPDFTKPFDVSLSFHEADLISAKVFEEAGSFDGARYYGDEVTKLTFSVKHG